MRSFEVYGKPFNNMKKDIAEIQSDVP